MKIRCKIQILVLISTLLLYSCDKYLDVGDPIDKVVANAVYESDISAGKVLTGIYIELSGGGVVTGGGSISAVCGAYADELNLISGGGGPQFAYINSIPPSAVPFWSELYSVVYKSNAAIEGLTKSKSLTADIKKQLLGEAKFIRAFCYFYLVNLFGQVPLLTSSDYKTNSIAYRAKEKDVYALIIEDLIEAGDLLSSDYKASDANATADDRVRPNKYAANALLARVYLYQKDWKNVVVESTKVISRVDLYDMVSLQQAFLKNSKEAIWQLQPVRSGIFNTEEARTFVWENGFDQFGHPFYISPFLIQAFEDFDLRKTNWLGVDSSTGNKYYYPFKYKAYKFDAPELEYLMVLRLGELYLIRAEANAKLGDLVSAKTDLNIIRKRAGLQDVIEPRQDEILSAILRERRVELFTEWGQRWFDLKRNNLADSIMAHVTPSKGGIWRTSRLLFPIPEGDIVYNRNLIQNPGY